jgi:hypothetical protein
VTDEGPAGEARRSVRGEGPAGEGAAGEARR